MTSPPISPEVESELREVLAPGLQLLQVVGQGGMGTVYLARDPALKRNVAVKVLAPSLASDATARTRFEREAQTAAAVAHPNVVDVYQVGTLPRSQTSYFVMQFVEGKTLEELVPPGAIVSEGRARRILGEIASALAAAHARGLVHRDIKPANVMLDAESEHVVVLDFGISAAVTPSRRAEMGTKLTQPGSSIGTPTYMSPEQASGDEVTEKSDIYSLGVVAFELLTGRPLFDEKNPMAVIAAHINKVAPSVAGLRPDLDPTIASLVERMLAKAPEARPTAAEAGRTLLPAHHALIEWPPPGLESLRGRGVQLTWSAAVTGAIALAGVGSFLLLPGPYDRIVVGGERWSFLALTILILVAGAAIVLAFGSILIANRIVAARRAGYPWRVIGDVLIDRGSGTAALLNGTGPFALISPAKRERLLQLRRRGALLAASTAAASILFPILWVSGVLGGLASEASTPISLAEFATLLLPLAVGSAAAIAAGVPGRRLHERPRGSWRHRERVTVRPDVLDAWLTASRSGARVEKPRASRVVIAIVPILLAVLVLVATYEEVLTGVKFENLRRRITPEASLQTFRAESLRPMPWLELDALVAEVAAVPVRARRTDLEAARLLSARGWRGPRGVPSYIAVDTALLARLPNGPEIRTESPIFRACPGLSETATFDGMEAAALRAAADTLDPWLAIWERVAASGELPGLWTIAPGTRSPEWVDAWRTEFRAVNGVACAALASGILRLKRGDVEAAARRAREVVAVGRHYIRSPTMIENVEGRTLVNAGGRLLSEVGRRSGRQDLLAQAARLGAATTRARADDRRLQNAILSLFADPGDSTMLSVIGDRTLAPAWRIRAARMTAIGACSNVREILFGPDPRRARLVSAAIAQLGDINGIEPITTRMNEILPGLESAEYMERILAEAGVARIFVLRSLPGVGRAIFRYRLSVCEVLEWIA